MPLGGDQRPSAVAPTRLGAGTGRGTSLYLITANHSYGFNKVFPEQLTPPGWVPESGSSVPDGYWQCRRANAGVGGSGHSNHVVKDSGARLAPERRRDGADNWQRCLAAVFLLAFTHLRNYFPSTRKIIRVPLSKCTVRLGETISDS
jgi:hypothetical protein